MTDLITLPRATGQQALDACTDAVAGWQSLAPLAVRRAAAESLDDLRAALEQPEPPPEAQTEAERLAYCAGWWAAMEQKREQPEQEPVAWMWRYDSCGHAVVNRLVVTETPEPTVFLTNVFARGPFPLYTHPPRREWRGLTEEEIWNDDKIMAENANCNLLMCDLVALYRAIEAALRSKNHE
jgi:hypothetical protein